MSWTGEIINYNNKRRIYCYHFAGIEPMIDWNLEFTESHINNTIKMD